MPRKEKTQRAAGSERGVGGTSSIQSIRTERIPVKSHSGQVVGEIADGTLTKHVDQTKHMLRSPRSWAMDTCILEQAQEYDVETVRLIDNNKNISWEAPLMAFYGKHSISLDRGFGKQRALLLSAWYMRGEGLPEQLHLWAVAA